MLVLLFEAPTPPPLHLTPVPHPRTHQKEIAGQAEMIIEQQDMIRDLRGELESKDAAHNKEMERTVKRQKQEAQKRKRQSTSRASKTKTKIATKAAAAFAKGISAVMTVGAEAAAEIERRKREARQLKKQLKNVAATSASRMKRLLRFKAKLEAADAAAMEQEEKNEELVDDLSNALGTWCWCWWP